MRGRSALDWGGERGRLLVGFIRILIVGLVLVFFLRILVGLLLRRLFVDIGVLRLGIRLLFHGVRLPFFGCVRCLLLILDLGMLRMDDKYEATTHAPSPSPGSTT